MSSNYRLKALIKAIRATKTLADERSVIQRESAAIRTSFKEDDIISRHANIAKLLYIHMLGYPAHLGQIECLKLAASPRFGDKRLGYLGVMLLLDENQEVLTLVTNSLKNDLNHANMYIVGLALCTLGNISSEAMARDLALEVEKLLSSSNSYIRKKAALCAMRICRKVPDLVEQFAGKARAMLSDRNHGTLLCGITLATELCLLDENCILAYRKSVPLLVRHLKSLTTAGYSPEHDVSGITDPFLQCKILQLFRVLGTGDIESSEAMNDILAQVASNTEGTKNVGNAILYESVLTILEIEADSGLRVLAVNILGRFLSNKDNNIRYVALNTLNKVVSLDTNAVQRHRNVILDCLRDGDISIRRRALELSYALINDGNIRVLIRELLAFLEIADTDFKTGMTTQICLAADRYAPNKRWHIDTVLRALKLAGNFVKEEIVNSFITLICHTPELQAYTAHKLYDALTHDLSQEALTIVGLWVIGEYGDILFEPLSGGAMEDDHAESMPALPQSDIVDLLEGILVSPSSNLVVHEYAMTCLAKLTVRLTEHPQLQRIRALLNTQDRSLEVEVQQRAVEFAKIYEHPDVRAGVLERMPLPEIKKPAIASVLTSSRTRRVTPSSPSKAEISSKQRDALFDLMGDGSSEMTSSLSSPPTSPNAKQYNGRRGPELKTASQSTTTDLLADLFGGLNTSGSSAAPSAPMNGGTVPPAKAQSSGVMDLIDGNGAVVPTTSETKYPSPGASDTAEGSTTLSTSSVGAEGQIAYNSRGLRIILTPVRDTKNPQVINVLARFAATTNLSVERISFQAAVPKTQKLQMMAMSGSTVTPTETQTQQMRVMVPGGSVAIRLRLKISYHMAGQDISDQVDFTGHA